MVLCQSIWFCEESLTSVEGFLLHKWFYLVEEMFLRLEQGSFKNYLVKISLRNPKMVLLWHHFLDFPSTIITDRKSPR